MRGGVRVGSGRKAVPRAVKWLGGDAGKRGRKQAAKPEARAAPVALIAAPRDLSPAQRAMWNRLAPHAAAQRTLIEATVPGFRDLCEALVVKAAVLARLEADGLTSADGERANPLLTHYRGLLQRVESGLARFRLAPFGKELTPASDAPQDAFAEFDGGDAVQ